MGIEIHQTVQFVFWKALKIHWFAPLFRLTLTIERQNGKNGGFQDGGH